jgi:hypothetical protein
MVKTGVYKDKNYHHNYYKFNKDIIAQKALKKRENLKSITCSCDRVLKSI